LRRRIGATGNTVPAAGDSRVGGPMGAKKNGAGDGNRTHTGGASEPLKYEVWCNCGFHV
jgi:hypothetical protein